MLERWRRETPGSEERIHFNNAGCSLSPQPVIDTVISYLKEEARIGGYELAENRASEIESFYQAAADLVGGRPDQIAFLEGATRAWEAAFFSIDWKPGDEVIVGVSEYSANYLSLLMAEKKYGIKIRLVSDDVHGQMSPEKIQQAITEKTKMICVAHVPSSSGLINPVVEIGKVAKNHGLLYFVDSCQSLGQISVDAEELQCDILCATGRKFLRGPRGTGFLYCSDRFLQLSEPNWIGVPAVSWNQRDHYQWRPDAKRFECTEKNFANMLGLSRAIQYANEIGISLISDRVLELASQLRERLSQIPSVELQDPGVHRCAIVTFSCQGKEAEEIAQFLTSRNANVAVITKAAARLDLVERLLPHMVRASVHYYNTIEEIETFCELVEQARR